jgi:uncharacterized protein YjbI with pentapeptide repeats
VSTNLKDANLVGANLQDASYGEASDVGNLVVINPAT